MAVLVSSTRVTVGGALPKVTVLSVLVDAVLPLPAASVARPAAIVATTVPLVVTPLPARVWVRGPPLTTAVFVPPAVPAIVTSVPVKLVTGSLKTAVNLIGALLVGSACPAAWLIVTVGAVVSAALNVTLPSVLVYAAL